MGVSLAAASGSAFETNEHQRISDAAACLARFAIQRTPEWANHDTQKREEVLDALATLGSDRATASYGDIVAYVDYSLFPTRLLAPGSGRVGGARLNADHIHDRLGNPVVGLEEVTRNGHHFRLEALRQFHWWHQQARRTALTAGSANEFYDALALNAYADHFLEDFFAPGHMVADEQWRSDAEMLHVHDVWNHKGGSFWVRDGGWNRVMPLDLEPEELNWCMPSLPKAESETDGGSWTEELRALRALPDGREEILFGDGELISTEHEAMRPRNVLIVTLAVMRSIQDVIDAYLWDASNEVLLVPFFSDTECDQTQDSTKDSCFGVGDGKPVYAANAVGVFAPRNPWGESGKAPIVRRACTTPSLVVAAGEVAASVAAGISRCLTSPFLLFRKEYPVFGFTVELQRLNEDSRKMISLEPWIYTIPTGWEHFTAETSLGYSYVIGNDYSGHGPDGHLYFRWKRVHAFAALDVGYRFYEGHGHSADLPRVGGRVGFGLGMLWIYAGVSRDGSIDDGRLDVDPTTWGLGVMLTASPSEIVRLGRGF